jgi:serine protease AprX
VCYDAAYRATPGGDPDVTFQRITRKKRLQARLAASAVALVLLFGSAPRAGVYVTETSGIRWNDVGGIRWNDVGGIRWNDVGGIRWNDVGGIRWNDVGGVLFTEASGIRWNDVGGIRWNDVGGLQLDDALATGRTSLDLELLSRFSALPDTSSINVIITYRSAPTASDLAQLNALGIPGGAIFRRLPMVVVNATRDQIRAIAALPAVRSVYANRTLSLLDEESRALIGLDEVASDPALTPPGGATLSGAGVTIAVLDSGVDAAHPDLPLGSKVVRNVRVGAAVGTGPGFSYPVPVEGLQNTDLILGHGTFVASVAAGTGSASGGVHRGIAPGASILSLSAGDLFIVNVLEGFDYILTHASQLGVRVVNCSWGTQGFFDPDDPVNIATHLLYDSGMTVVFAAGNYGPAPDTLNPYAVAPWVIGVGSTRKDGRLSGFSSRGIFEELLYHPTLVAPGEQIVGASPVALNGGAPYTTASGTSYAAPHVAGVVALMLEARPSLSPAAIKRILQSTAIPILVRDRSEVGAGGLDAWAALTLAADPARPFGTHVPGWLDERPFRIDHRPAVLSSAILPARSTLALPLTLAGAPISWQMTLAWGTVPGLSDLDVSVLDQAGHERARAETQNGTSLFGRAEGIHLLGDVPSAMTMEVFFKNGTGLADQPFQIRQETALAVVTGYLDVPSLPPAERDLVARAVGRRVIVGRGDRFEAASGLRRGELARSLALVAARPQRIPASPSFSDTHASDPDYPYVESVAGARARRVLIDPQEGSAFQPRADVSRLDFAVAMVRAAGRDAEAETRAGGTLGLTDEDKIPAALRGYVAVALELGLIDTAPASGGARFDPKGSVPRLDAARFLLRLLDLP